MQKQASYIVIYYPKIIIKQIQIILLLVLFSVKGSSQSKIAITIDDVPNHTSTQHLYTELDKLKIPICIFINEGRPLRDSSKTTVNEFLSQWAKRKYVTFGNHTFNHLRYSDVGFDSFKNDITKGEVITKSVVTLKNKKLKYFRFPYNDLGNDSILQSKIKQFISSRGYIIAPFTVESIDWMYNFLYEKFLALNDSINADKIGQAYVHKTMEYISHFEKLSFELWGRNINHIYLCHDNRINVKFLPIIISKIKSKNYKLISLEEALKDKIYKNKNFYNKKWGISWMYRWIESSEKRKTLMKSEPSVEDVEKMYNELQKKN